MTKEEIEEIVGKGELTTNEFSLDKKIYAGKLYFFKREIEQDHYFYVKARNTLYKMIYNPSNYDDTKVETGKHPDSFQYPFDEYIAEGKVIDYENTPYTSLEKSKTILPKTEIKKEVKTTKSIQEELDTIILKLVELKSRL